MAAPSDHAASDASATLGVVSLAEALTGADRLRLFAIDGSGRARRADEPFVVVDGGLVVAGDAGLAAADVAVIASVRRQQPSAVVSVAVAVEHIRDERLAAHFARVLPAAATAGSARAWLVLRPTGTAIERSVPSPPASSARATN